MLKLKTTSEIQYSTISPLSMLKKTSSSWNISDINLQVSLQYNKNHFSSRSSQQEAFFFFKPFFSELYDSVRKKTNQSTAHVKKL